MIQCATDFMTGVAIGVAIILTSLGLGMLTNAIFEWWELR